MGEGVGLVPFSFQFFTCLGSVFAEEGADTIGIKFFIPIHCEWMVWKGPLLSHDVQCIHDWKI